MKLVVLRDPQPVPVSAGRHPHEPAPTSRHGAVALSDQGHQWVLLNVAPHVAGRLGTTLTRSNPLDAGADVRNVVLTDAQVDHVSGLLSLRDGGPINLYATPAVFEVLSQSLPVLQVLQHYCGVHWHVIPVAGETEAASFRIDGLPLLEFTALAAQGAAPPYLPEHENASTTGLSIALAVRDVVTGQRLFCARGGLHLGPAELDWMRTADCVLIDDPTTWAPDSTTAPSPAAHRAQRTVVFGDAGTDGLHPAHLGFEPAYDGMVIDL